MHINKINNINFKRIILDCDDPISASLLFASKDSLDKNRPNNDFDPLQFLNGNLLPQVIQSDYKTPLLQRKYKDLVESQENNPHNIHLDLFLYDEGEIPLYPEGWYQKAVVGGKVFLQRLYAFQGSAIKFLEDACAYANKLNREGRPVIDKLAKDVPMPNPKWTNFKMAMSGLSSIL